MDPSGPGRDRAISSSSRASYDYDVFFSYLGRPTQRRFAARLYQALGRSKLRVFRDNVMHLALWGERMDTPKVEKARERSRITIVLVSKYLLSAVWLAEELMRIFECRRSFGSLVVPVLYDVDPSEISDGWFWAAGLASDEQRWENKTKTLENWTDKLDKWRKVLRELSDSMSFVFPSKATNIKKSITIQRFVDFIKDGLKRKDISMWRGTECHLMNSGLSKLPENMNFQALRELLLQDNYDLSEIPPSFFEFMPALQVLDMSRTSIKYLPPSIFNLVELQKLLLRGCKLLMELPAEIRALENLKVFDLAGTELIYIPKEIKMLSKLEHLEVSLCACADEYISEIKENGEIIPRKTLSKLLNLKELSIFVDPDCEWWYTEVEAIIQDLINLEKLETVKLYFPTVELLQKFLQLPWVKFQSLSNFRLIVGRHDQGIISRVPHDLQDSFEALEKCLKYVNGEGIRDGIGQALKHARALFLDRHWTIDQLSTFMGDEMDKLRFCLLVECNEMITVIDGGGLHLGGDNGDKSKGGKPIPGLLQYLSIHYMKNLESILVGPLASGCLYHLQILTLHTCPKLTTIFSFGFLSNLMNLKELIVEDCPKVESIVTVESSHLESGEEFLPRLEKISLLHLPGLVSISSGLRLAPRLERMVVYNCPKLQSLSPMEMSSKNIKEIKGESEWWEGLEWKILEWKSNQPDYLRRVFVPLRRDGLINQLAEARNSHNSLIMIQNSGENQLISAMATDLADKAKEAFIDDDFQLVVDLYTQSIDLCPKNADLFADRAQANIKLNNFTNAVADASKANELDPSMAKAYLHKGTACFKLEKYHTAKAALATGASLQQDDSRFTKLLKECEDRIAEEIGDPNESEKLNKTTNATLAPVGYQTSDISVGHKLKSVQGENELNQMEELALVKPKYWHSFYQKPEEVVVTVFAKGIPANNVAIDFGEQILSVTINLPGEDVYCFQPKLFGRIVPEKCRYEVLKTIIEIRLVKAEAIKWTSLEHSKEEIQFDKK